MQQHKFPLNPQTKRPAVVGWQTWEGEVTTEPYGLACGPRNGMWVLDVDRKGGVDGLRNLSEIVPEDLPDTYTVRTPSGGFHLYFAWDDQRPVYNRQAIVEGVDVRGQGGLVAAGGPYVVVQDLPLAVAPEWLYDLVKRRVGPENSEPVAAIGPEHPDWDYRVAEAEKFLSNIPPCVNGAGGDKQLWAIALRMSRTYELPPEKSLELMREYNGRCAPPWSDGDILRKLRDAATKGTGPTGMFSPDSFLGGGGGPEPEKVPGVIADDGPWVQTHNPAHAYSFDIGAQIAGGNQKATELNQKQITSSLAGPGAHPPWRGVIRYDAFSERVRAINPPLHLEAEEAGSITNRDICNIRMWYAYYGWAVTKPQIEDAIETAAGEARMHPIRDYLDALRRTRSEKSAAGFSFENSASRLWGCPPEADAVESELFKRQCVAACRRVRQPGIKSDDMLILHGEQGLGKSRFLRKLFGEHFLDQLPHDWTSKDAASLLRGKWGIEVAELAGFSRTEENARKSFLSRQEDEYRGAYDRRETRRLRQCVFFGSTNDDVFLRDPTGGRRYNVVHVLKEIDVDAFERDDLWAAADELERAGYPHFFPRAEAADIAEHRATHGEISAWDDVVSKYLATAQAAGKRWMTAAECLQYAIVIPLERQDDHMGKMRGILRRLCGPTHVVKDANGRSARVYRVPIPSS